ncbi:glycosyltransferase family 1 protein [Butyrivibrio sp. INlla16]|uniref:glycosyltransferase family 4 protein n=1 Tax=Butyrivibrio sp. INlla16 TaxID=1520807 RepID=UPI0008848475|nr:glycosyltransferase family 1 protein [Butyrivibrio sp. INlla16]SDB18984.1 Glycosyltransferase involved in cell wall bisynthesis [Butyrivibrio sp. INlla16]
MTKKPEIPTSKSNSTQTNSRSPRISLHLREFVIRFWPVTLAALIGMLIPAAGFIRVLAIYFAIYACFFLGKNLAKKHKNAIRKSPHPGFSKEHPLIINGRIFAQHVTGVQRYGIEIIKKLDEMLEPGEAILALPYGELQTQPELKNIEMVRIGKGNGNKWTQFHLPIFAFKKRGTILTLAAIAPAVKPDYVVAHDISFIRYPESYGKAFRFMYRCGYLITLYRCKGIITISEFSRDELIKYYELDEDKFAIVGNSAEQILEKQETSQDSQKGTLKPDQNKDEDILSRWNIAPGERYYLSVGSKNLHKNQIYIKKLAQKYPDRKFIVAGGSATRSFSAAGDISRTESPENAHNKMGDLSDSTNKDPADNPSNLVLTGYVLNEELRTLYNNAYAFIFPSLYEGFGIPPMEAILSGVKHIALADIPVLREIYPVGCYFFDPRNADTFDIEKLDGTKEPIITPEIQNFYKENYTWEKSARNIMDFIR